MPVIYLTIKEFAEKRKVNFQSVQRAARNGDISGAIHTNPQNPRRGEWKIPADTDWRPRTYTKK
jgi:hypothetical protein